LKLEKSLTCSSQDFIYRSNLKNKISCKGCQRTKYRHGELGKIKMMVGVALKNNCGGDV
jgi:hypothetical protein